MKKKKWSALISPLLMTLLLCAYKPWGLWGCDESGGNCNRFTQSGCDNGLSCEMIEGGDTGCFAPLVARGQVTNLADGTAISQARIIALTADGLPISSVTTSDASGNYELTVFMTRKSDGIPVSDNFTLRADALGFQTYPSGLRQPIPIDTSSPIVENNKFVIQSALTNIGLIALPDGSGTASVHGTVELPENSTGVLVVAESSPTTGYSAIADRTGDYKIFNLPSGSYTVNGYVQGSNYTPVSATLTDGQDAGLDLIISGEATAALNGKVEIVNPGAGSQTSVILVVASTFNRDIVRGETPPGLRAPTPGTAPDITGNFTISGIPTGNYVILAAFENDFLVRDPDTCIGGTDIMEQEFVSGETVDLSSGFKITGSLDVISPGANGPEAVTTSTPIFTWNDDSSEDEYELSVFDSFGNKIWDTTVPGVTSGNPSVTYNTDGTGAGTAQPLEPGMFYQFRATAKRTSGGGKVCETSQTEDLKGVFYLQ